MSKLAIDVAMPWNLSISVVSILLKNLVLMMSERAFRFFAFQIITHKKIRELLSGPRFSTTFTTNKKAHG